MKRITTRCRENMKCDLGVLFANVLFQPIFFFLSFLVSGILTGRKEIDNGTTPAVMQRPLRSKGILDNNITSTQEPSLPNKNRIWPTLATVAESRPPKHLSLSLRHE